MATYVQQQPLRRLPRLPLSGNIDLTYRCNNTCRHCWLWLPPGSPEQQRELSFDEIKRIVDDARSMGCRNWGISGGEPMLRPAFPEIFDYITTRSTSYTLNTNGTLITPAIAQLLKRKGAKMIALYGATADVYDHVTRHAGGFEKVMRGFRYMKEAGAGFIVQIIPMRDNYHQLQDMITLAQSLSSHYRVGAAWLYLSASGSPQVNKEIMRQRVDPRDVIDLDKPDMAWEDANSAQEYHHPSDGCLFSACATTKSEFHIDPYGQMSFCCFIKDPAMRYDLRKGTFQEGWDNFIPSLAGCVQTNEEYQANCGSCEMRHDCRWCPVYGYLEHGRFTAKVDYLCAVAAEKRAYGQDWLAHHRRFYQCAGLTIQIDSDEPIGETTFDPKFKVFEVAGPGEDNISIRHHFSLPDMNEDLGQELYRKPPWAIYKKGDSWIYKGISPVIASDHVHQVAVFNHDYARARVYSKDASHLRKGKLSSLTFFPTDQILLAQLLADRQGCYLHSSGVILDGQGLMFVGHSEAGKSTTVKMLKPHAEILCDDRNIVRRWPDGFRIHGTWSHGEVPDCSPNSAPLRAILFLVKDTKNQLIAITDKAEVSRRLLACLIKPFVTAEWWQKTLTVIEQIANEVPCYEMHFDKSGQIVDVLRRELTTT
jgi:MoaA/NifB/PqqE/SkfB family radical SAM enzyme